MSPYALAVWSLVLAILAQCTVTGIATWVAFCPPYRRTSVALAVGLGLLALHHTYDLELALHSGIFDLRQAILAACISLLLLLGFLGFRPRTSQKRPPR